MRDAKTKAVSDCPDRLKIRPTLLYYERSGLNVRLSYNYASAFIDEMGKTKFEDRYYDAVNYLDLNASYTFAKHYTFYVEANNLLNQPLRYYQGSKGLDCAKLNTTGLR